MRFIICGEILEIFYTNSRRFNQISSMNMKISSNLIYFEEISAEIVQDRKIIF
jgi:uncharacterized membrane protein